MPTPVTLVKNSKHHMTTAEREAREAAEAALQRPTRVVIRAPEWLSPEAKAAFDTTKRRLRALGILDNADTDLLAIYADAITGYKAAPTTREKLALARLALSYADKLGISPAGRARLAKNTAEAPPADDLEALFNEVEEYVNQDVG